MLFPDSGTFPFRGGHFLGVIASSVGLFVVLPRSARVLRIASLVLAASAVPIYLVANPLGGNLARISIFFVVPVLAAALWNRRRGLVVLAALPLSLWVVLPGAAADAARSLDDPSADAAYFEPLLAFLAMQSGPTGRLEIPFTEGHWETAFVAPHVPLARGWERQIDRGRNPLFYEDSIDPVDYHRWIRENAVRWIALPDVDLDHSAHVEAALLLSGDLPWLDPVLTTEHWQVWEVRDALPLVEAPGLLVADTADGITLHVPEPATVLVRARFTPYWAVSGVDACIAENPAGLTLVTVAEPGTVTLPAPSSRSNRS